MGKECENLWNVPESELTREEVTNQKLLGLKWMKIIEKTKDIGRKKLSKKGKSRKHEKDEGQEKEKHFL